MEEMETVQDTSVQETEEQDLFLDGLEDDNTSIEESEEKTTDEAADEEQTDEPTKSEEKPDVFSITVNGEKMELTNEELIAAAQKGMDYDRVKGELERYRSELGEAAKKSGMTVQDFIKSALDGFNAAQKEELRQSYIDKGYDEDTAELLAQKDLQLKAKEKAEEEQRAEEEQAKTEESKRKQDIERFLKANPNVNADEIPDEVWADVNQGYTLTESYLRYKVGQQELQLKAAQKNEENKQRSAGSAKTSKAPKQDAFLTELMRD